MRRPPAQLLAVLLLASACDGSGTPTAPAAPPLAALPLELVTDHFLLRYSTPSAGLMNGYAEALETNRQRIADDLGVASLSRVEGLFHPDQASFAAATGFSQGVGSVDGPNRFHLVAIPFAPSNAVHELAHNVTLHLTSGVSSQPVWLWESVAIWESNQFVEPATVPHLVAGDFPTLAELSDRDGPYSIYLVGYTIAELIVEEWQLEGLRRLIVARGDLPATFGITTEEFERRWRWFVEDRYL